MTYTEALEYIHGTSNFFCKPGLERITQLCRELGNPQKNLKFIHVGGTNGKGSFCAMMDSVLRKEGYKVGLYTSPFVLKFNERMRINGENIPNETLARLTEKVKKVAEKMEDSPTEFELITAIALEYFKEEKCQVVIWEVGMGGRLDATNIIDSPLLSVITGVDIDHTAFLGDTVEKIAGEKAGIIKSGSPILFGGENYSAEAVIAEEAKKKQTILCKTDYSKLKIHSSDLNGTTFDYRDRVEVKISLLGSYQPRNAAVVLDALDILSSLGLKVKEENIRAGLLEAKWQARFEIINENPLVIFDGAHNPQGISAAVESVKLYFKDKKVVILSGVLGDKDFLQIAESLCQVASQVFTITPDNPRALSAVDYAEVIGKLNAPATPCESIAEAIKLGIIQAQKEKTALICLGSLYTYSEVSSEIKSYK